MRVRAATTPAVASADGVVAAGVEWRRRAAWGFRARLAGSIAFAMACILFGLTQGAADIPLSDVVRILLHELGLPLNVDWTAAEADDRYRRAPAAGAAGGNGGGHACALWRRLPGRAAQSAGRALSDRSGGGRGARRHDRDCVATGRQLFAVQHADHVRLWRGAGGYGCELSACPYRRRARRARRSSSRAWRSRRSLSP